MCGIVGLLRWDGKPIERSVVQAMTDAIAHRGPDGEGLLIRDNVGLGHRRLAIIDPDGGHQPLSNEDEQIWITYNGELYNFPELRRDLESKGHIFRTSSDTEAIVHAYEEWGDQCVERFRGMFAFAIADFRNHRLFLARDHLGIKPLYYVHYAGFFAFSSELQALHHLPDLDLNLNLQAIDEYFWLRYIPAPHTAFRQAHKLSPAHRMSVSFDGECRGPEAYWRLSFDRRNDWSGEEWAEALDHTLRESVEAHLISDVPFGAFLSGGVDSSAIVAYMAQILDQPVRTFTIGFAEQGFDERPYAQVVADHWSTEHHVDVVQPEALKILPDLVKHYGEPFGDSSAIPTYYVSQIACQSVPMVLSGDGGDEFFLGYSSYLRWKQWLEYEDCHSMPYWKSILYPLAHKLFPHRYAALKERNPTPQDYLHFVQYLNSSWRKAIWRPEYENVPLKNLNVFEESIHQAWNYSPEGIAQYLDIIGFLPGDILTKVDVASMMHGLEVRTPIVDIRVLELAAQIPVRQSVVKNSNGKWEGKHLLKETMGRYYRKDLLKRSKQGFSVPTSQWFRSHGPLDGVVQEKLLSHNSRLYEYFEPVVIQELVKQTNSGQKLWMLLFLEEWLKQNRELTACG